MAHENVILLRENKLLHRGRIPPNHILANKCFEEILLMG